MLSLKRLSDFYVAPHSTAMSFFFFRCLEFMSRQTAHAKLLEKPPGTFLIRFSDGELGAVTIAWCCERNG